MPNLSQSPVRPTSVRKRDRVCTHLAAGGVDAAGTLHVVLDALTAAEESSASAGRISSQADECWACFDGHSAFEPKNVQGVRGAAGPRAARDYLSRYCIRIYQPLSGTTFVSAGATEMRTAMQVSGAALRTVAIS